MRIVNQTVVKSISIAAGKLRGLLFADKQGPIMR